MITLYDYLPSQNAYKVRLLLNHLEQPYQTKIVSIFEGEGKTDAFKGISPTGAVPAIELENGNTLAESNAILVYLADGTDYLPDDQYLRAKVMQWLFFEGETIQNGIATLRHWVQTGKDKNRTSEILASKRDLCLKGLEILDKALSGQSFLVGDRYSIADISVFGYTHLADEAGVQLSNFLNVMRWIDRVRSQDRFLGEIHPYSIDPYSGREL